MFPKANEIEHLEQTFIVRLSNTTLELLLFPGINCSQICHDDFIRIIFN